MSSEQFGNGVVETKKANLVKTLIKSGGINVVLESESAEKQKSVLSFLQLGAGMIIGAATLHDSIQKKEAEYKSQVHEIIINFEKRADDIVNALITRINKIPEDS